MTESTDHTHVWKFDRYSDGGMDTWHKCTVVGCKATDRRTRPAGLAYTASMSRDDTFVPDIDEIIGAAEELR